MTEPNPTSAGVEFADSLATTICGYPTIRTLGVDAMCDLYGFIQETAADTIDRLTHTIEDQAQTLRQEREEIDRLTRERDEALEELSRLHPAFNDLGFKYATVLAERDEARKLVRGAYNEGFTEGMREHTSSRGGNVWQDSRSCAALAAPTNGRDG